MPKFFFDVSFKVGELSDVVRFVGGFDSYLWPSTEPLIGGSASSKVMSGSVSPSTTDLAALSAVSLYSTSVCDLTFPICVLSCFSSLAFSSWFVRCKRSLWRWWLYDAGSIV